jgi:hypothetical protein
MVTPAGQPGNPEQDVSTPINWAYNHHYMMWQTGAHSQIAHVPRGVRSRLRHRGARRPVGAYLAVLL